MKKKIFVVLFVVLISISCNKDFETFNQFFVKNSSKHDVKLKVTKVNFQTQNLCVDTTYYLPDNYEIVYNIIEKGKGSGSYFPFGPSADSAFIIFDDTLQIVFVKYDEQPRNILNYNSFTLGKKSDDLYKFYYTITEDDYNLALNRNK